MGRTAGRLATLLYAVAAGTYILDRTTKVIAEHTLAGEPPLQIIPGVLDLNYTTNSGGAFGLGRSAPLVFAAATVVVAIAIGLASFRLTRASAAVALGLILGGALGNLTDRVLHGSGVSGSVTDFIDFQIWPVFNLADSGIVIGAIVLAFGGLRRDEPDRPGEP